MFFDSSNPRPRTQIRGSPGGVAPRTEPPSAGLTGQRIRSMFVLMEVETLGVARSLGWKVHMRCANGYRQETRSMRKCVYRNPRIQVRGWT